MKPSNLSHSTVRQRAASSLTYGAYSLLDPGGRDNYCQLYGTFETKVSKGAKNDCSLIVLCCRQSMKHLMSHIVFAANFGNAEGFFF